MDIINPAPTFQFGNNIYSFLLNMYSRRLG